MQTARLPSEVAMSNAEDNRCPPGFPRQLFGQVTRMVTELSEQWRTEVIVIVVNPRNPRERACIRTRMRENPQPSDLEVLPGQLKVH